MLIYFDDHIVVLLELAGKFIAGKYYALQVRAETNEGYTIPAVRFNGELVEEHYTDRGNPAQIDVLCIIGQIPTQKVIREDSVTGVAAPVAGKAPSKSYSISGSGYKADSITWMVKGEYDWVEFDGKTFEKGKIYAVEFEIGALSGYTFPLSSYLFGSFLINGNPAEIYYAVGDGADILLAFDPAGDTPPETTSTPSFSIAPPCSAVFPLKTQLTKVATGEA